MYIGVKEMAIVHIFKTLRFHLHNFSYIEFNYYQWLTKYTNQVLIISTEIQ